LPTGQVAVAEPVRRPAIVTDLDTDDGTLPWSQYAIAVSRLPTVFDVLVPVTVHRLDAVRRISSGNTIAPDRGGASNWATTPPNETCSPFGHVAVTERLASFGTTMPRVAADANANTGVESAMETTTAAPAVNTVKRREGSIIGRTLVAERARSTRRIDVDGASGNRGIAPTKTAVVRFMSRVS
jgi:hypothetical protein